MKSPFTGGEVQIKKEIRAQRFRKELFDVQFQFYLCKDTGEQFTDEDMDTANINQVYNQYRVKYGIPFPDEIKSIREQYGLSASKMSEILGLGANIYRNYETGEVPSVSNGRLIQLAKQPEEFRRLLALSENELTAEEVQKINKKIKQALAYRGSTESMEEALLLGSGMPGITNGYRAPDLLKVNHMVLFFSKQLEPFKTKLNKLLFYTDFFHFKRTGFSISGLTYKAIQNGPVPNHYDLLFDDCVKKGFVSVVNHDYGNYTGEQFQAHEGAVFLDTIFTPGELKALELVAKYFESDNARQIAKKSHEEDGWKDNINDHNVISYAYGFDLKYPIAEDLSLTRVAAT
jgi:putative zinc finger/helix-turn-helix YgiT family protein